MAMIILLALVGGVLGVALSVGWLNRLSVRVDALELELARIARGLRASASVQPAQATAPRSATTVEPRARPDTSVARTPADARAASPSSSSRQSLVVAQAGVQTHTSAAQPSVPERAPAERRAELEPSLVEQASAQVVRWFTTGNVPAKVGVVLSVFGVGFLVKEGIDRHWFVLPVELRLAVAAVFGVVLLALGWRLRGTHRAYALSVQGGGIAVLYLTIYSSFALFHVMVAPAAFALLLVVTAAAGSLAVLQDSRGLAVLGIVGGFMAPVLVSTGKGDHVVLFSYYAVLNVAILGIAWFKAWRELNVLGFLFTFGIGSFWGYHAYTTAHFATTEPFLILFALMYIAIPILFATRVRSDLRGFVDGTLVFGMPLVAFGLQGQLVGDTQYGLSISALALAALYAGTAMFMLTRRSGELRVLGEAHVALGVAFLTVAVPLALDMRQTSVAWALEGAGMVWVGFRQRRRLALAAGVVLQLLSGLAYVLAHEGAQEQPVVNAHLLDAVVIALGGAFSARLFERAADEREGRRGVAQDSLEFPPVAAALLAWASGWWLYAGLHEIHGFVPHELRIAVDLLFLCATTLVALAGGARLAWPRLNHLGVALWVAAMPAVAIALSQVSHPAQNLGWLAWPATLATMLSFLYAREQLYPVSRGLLHAAAYWLAAALLVWETHWLASTAHASVSRLRHGIWPAAAQLAVGAAFVLATLTLLDRMKWPLAANRDAYLRLCCGGALAVLLLATLSMNALSDGNAAPLPYVPLLNSLELASVFVCVALFRWLAELERSAPSLGLDARHRATFASLFGLFLVTMAVARAVHHWAGVPFTLERLDASTVFQTSLSIVWGATALGAMVSGAHRDRRVVWLAGAALMGVVVLKLFVVDLGNRGTLERIVSFLGVGLLLLVVGYFAPVPPRTDRDVFAHPDGG